MLYPLKCFNTDTGDDMIKILKVSHEGGKVPPYLLA